MKLLVFSDTHRCMHHMESTILDETPDTVIHLGDHDRDAQQLASVFTKLPIVSVQGNCDFYSPFGKERIIGEWGGIRMLLTHGHKFHVKSGLLRLSYAAQEAGVQAVLFGHTHIPYCEQHNGIWFLNPGSCGFDRPTYGIVNISNGCADYQLKRVD